MEPSHECQRVFQTHNNHETIDWKVEPNAHAGFPIK